MIRFKCLQTLSLGNVYIADETFEKIISGCPLIECVDLVDCEGLRTIKLINTHHHLKIFDFHNFSEKYKREDYCSIKIDVPTIETILVEGCPKWFGHHRKKYFPHLRTLYLGHVRLFAKSFDSFSSNFPCLEKLNLDRCYGFKKVKLSSRSIKHLSINVEGSIKAAIDAANISYFEISCYSLPSISFTTASEEWKSHINLSRVPVNEDNDLDSSLWFHKLNDVLRSLSQSEISLCLSQDYRTRNRPLIGVAEKDIKYDGLYNKPLVVVELLKLWLYDHSSSSLSALICGLFPTCQPIYLGQFWLYAEAKNEWEIKVKPLTEFLCKIFITERETREYFWQQDLQEVSIETLDKNRKEWHPISLSELRQNNDFRFRLKWRE